MGRNNKHKRGARNQRGPVRSERRPSLTGRVQLHAYACYCAPWRLLTIDCELQRVYPNDSLSCRPLGIKKRAAP